MIKERLLKFFKLDGLIDNLSGYVEARIELVKYELKEDFVHTIARLSIILIIMLFLTLFILFIGVSIAYVLAEYVGLHSGFAIVAGFYLLLILALIVFREPIGKKLEKEIKKIMHRKHHEDTGNG